MFGLFGKKKPPIDNADAQWIFATFDWALASFGAGSFYHDTVLVTPGEDHFPAAICDPALQGRGLFDRVREYAGMSDWSCSLRAGETTQIDAAAAADRVIDFHPGQLQYPDSLVATFAHGLAGFLCDSAETPPPGERGEHQAPDVVAVLLGFGIFTCNSAAAFGQGDASSSQWITTRAGSLPEAQLVYTLAIFCALKAIDASEVSVYLDPELHELLERSLKSLHNHDQLALLQARQDMPESPLSIPMPPS